MLSSFWLRNLSRKNKTDRQEPVDNLFDCAILNRVTKSNSRDQIIFNFIYGTLTNFFFMPQWNCIEIYSVGWSYMQIWTGLISVTHGCLTVKWVGQTLMFSNFLVVRHLGKNEIKMFL